MNTTILQALQPLMALGMNAQRLASCAAALDGENPADVAPVVMKLAREWDDPYGLPTPAVIRARCARAREHRRRKETPSLMLIKGDPFEPKNNPGMPAWAREEITLLRAGELKWTGRRLAWTDGRDEPLPRDRH